MNVFTDQVPRKVIRPTDRVPDGLQRIDGSLCLDLLPLEYYGKMYKVIQGPLYDPAAIDRWKMYDSVGMAVYQGFPIWWASMFADPNRPIKPSDLSGEGR